MVNLSMRYSKDGTLDIGKGWQEQVKITSLFLRQPDEKLARKLA